MQQNLNLGIAPVEAFLLKSDIPDALAGNVLKITMGGRLRPANLSGEDDSVGRA